MNSQSAYSEKIWRCFETILDNYAAKYTPSQCKCFKGCEEIWVLLRLFILVLFLCATSKYPDISSLIILSGPIIYLTFDILAFHTSMVFIHRYPINILRTVFLTFVSYISVAVSFSTSYRALSSCFNKNINAMDAVYFSFVTIATVGYGDIAPEKCSQCNLIFLLQLLIMLEIIIGLYFVVIVLATIAAWVNGNFVGRID